MNIIEALQANNWEAAVEGVPGVSIQVSGVVNVTRGDIEAPCALLRTAESYMLKVLSVVDGVPVLTNRTMGIKVSKGYVSVHQQVAELRDAHYVINRPAIDLVAVAA